MGDQAMNELERNKLASARFTAEVINAVDASNVDEFRDPAYRVHRFGFANLHELTGRHFVAEGDTDPAAGARGLHAAFPDWHAEVVMQVAEGDTVFTMLRVTGMHTGEFLGIPPTGRRVEFVEVGYRRFVDGRMAEGWWLADELSLLRQLGVDVAEAIERIRA